MSEVEEAVSKGICTCCRRNVPGGDPNYIRTGMCPSCLEAAE